MCIRVYVYTFLVWGIGYNTNSVRRRVEGDFSSCRSSILIDQCLSHFYHSGCSMIDDDGLLGTALVDISLPSFPSSSSPNTFGTYDERGRLFLPIIQSSIIFILVYNTYVADETIHAVIVRRSFIRRSQCAGNKPSHFVSRQIGNGKNREKIPVVT